MQARGNAGVPHTQGRWWTIAPPWSTLCSAKSVGTLSYLMRWFRCVCFAGVPITHTVVQIQTTAGAALAAWRLRAAQRLHNLHVVMQGLGAVLVVPLQVRKELSTKT